MYDNKTNMTEIDNRSGPAMKQLNVTVQCLAVYNSHIMVPAHMTLEEAIEYARDHMDEIPVGNLEYVMDSDQLDEDNCDLDGEFTGGSLDD